MAEKQTIAATVSALEGAVDGIFRVELVVVLEDPPMLAGAARLGDVDEGTVVLSDLLVHASLRRLGLGRQLVRAARQWADQRGLDLFLHVQPGNLAARALYEAERFQYVGTRTPEGSVWMVKVAHEGRLAQELRPADCPAISTVPDG